jgi:hypothetical protein
MMPKAEGEVKQGDQKVMIANPEYEIWLAADQQVPGFILASVSKEIFVHTPTAKTVAEALKILEEQFSSQTRAWLWLLRGRVAYQFEYLAEMQGIDNNIAMSGKTLDDEDLV